jgi:hypothetical protein
LQIDSIANILVALGDGTVSLASALPSSSVTLDSNQRGSITLAFHWPSTARRISFSVDYSANGGAYMGSANINLVR